MRTVAIVQARTGSTRLPGKVLLPLAGQPMLARVLRRVQRAAGVDEVVVATTRLPADDGLVELCARLQVRCWRGCELDVLDRYYEAARAFQADVLIRITSDCPLIDPELIGQAVVQYQARQPGLDYLATHEFPRGLDVEVFSHAALERAWRGATDPAWREHVTLFLYRHPEQFHLAELRCPQDLSALRWTVDTPEDFELVRRVYEHFGHDEFSWGEVVALLHARPEWTALNQAVRQKEVPKEART